MTGTLEQFFIEKAPVREVVAVAGKAFIGLGGSGGPPGSVHVERLTLLAVDSTCVVLAITDQLVLACARRLDALVGVAVALASASNREVRDCVEIGAQDTKVVENFVAESVHSDQYDLYFGRSNPFLQIQSSSIK